ncbi:hypothetical protein AVEN_223192-1 [Araneus ventricosus]|uniref:Uncharacterized protein n=1 Tax=Araneus ventricosus TaxID=182803 RepID=A0A4Y2VR03_ARAVE|nr:hypothetical protein AVEN_223192-1 [Araneus ventricosus]
MLLCKCESNVCFKSNRLSIVLRPFRTHFGMGGEICLPLVIHEPAIDHSFQYVLQDNRSKQLGEQLDGFFGSLPAWFQPKANLPLMRKYYSCRIQFVEIYQKQPVGQ